MNRILMFLGVLLMLLSASAWAQRPDQQRSEPMDSRSEKEVHIVKGPTISDVTRHSAVIRWTTNSSGANHVRYRVAGSHNEWQSAYHQGGGNYHSLELTNLEPHRTYEWQILTRDGDVRKQGEFQTK